MKTTTALNGIQAMRRIALLVAVVLFGVGSHSSVGWAAITYRLVDGAAGDQNGHTLSGTITFDSACRTLCTAADVDSFSVAWTGPTPASFSGAGPADVGLLMNDVLFDVSLFGISYDSPGLIGLFTKDRFVLGDQGQGTARRSPRIEWTFFDAQIGVSRYSGIAPGNVQAWSVAPTTGRVMIATVVPEPRVTVAFFIHNSQPICDAGSR